MKKRRTLSGSRLAWSSRCGEPRGEVDARIRIAAQEGRDAVDVPLERGEVDADESEAAGACRACGRAPRPAPRSSAIPRCPAMWYWGCSAKYSRSPRIVIASSGSQALRGSPWWPSTGTPRRSSQSNSGSKRASSIITARPSGSRCCMPMSFQNLTATAPSAKAASSPCSTPVSQPGRSLPAASKVAAKAIRSGQARASAAASRCCTAIGGKSR